MSASTRSPDTEARELLTRYWADTRGNLPLPVDPVYIARQLGLEVWATDLDRDTQGVLVGNPGVPATIHVNARDARTRQRYTCAHEIGHYLRRATSGDQQFGFVDKRDHLAAEGVDEEERWANAFAACLLMPEDLVRASLQRDPQQLAGVFEVSTLAMRYRLSNLGLR